MHTRIFHLALTLLALSLSMGSTAHAAEPPPTDVSAEAPAGKTVTLAVTAQGTAPFAYQWERAPLPGLTGSATWTPIAGATSDKLVLTGVSAANTGVYRVRITNSAGAITSPTATLRLAVGPTIEAYTITISGE